jgi:hypothetical protein
MQKPSNHFDAVARQRPYKDHCFIDHCILSSSSLVAAPDLGLGLGPRMDSEHSSSRQEMEMA